MPSLRVIGPGRAGRSLARALSAAGWDVAGVLGRDEDVRAAADGVDVLAITTPDDAVAAVAARIAPVESTLVMHMAGSLTLEPLAAHPKVASMHPLASLPDEELGAATLTDACPVALAGDGAVSLVVEALQAVPFEVPDSSRALYHAAAAVAANHLVVLLAQVERLTAAAGVPFDPFVSMCRSVLDNVATTGAAAALTGPASRGDLETILRHLDAMSPNERSLYGALALGAAELAGASLPLETAKRC